MIVRFTLVIGLCAIGMVAAAQDELADEQAHGRVSFSDESALVRGSEDDDWSYATVNALILPGDTVWADNESALEIEFPGATFVRMADGSKLEIATVLPETRVAGTKGSFYVHRLKDATGPMSFEFPAGAASVDPDTQVRFDIFKEGSTTVSVRLGTVHILTPSGESVVSAGQRAYVDPGYGISEPESFDLSFEDDFDSWNRDRSRTVARGGNDIPIFRGSDSVAPVGAWSLHDQGRWIYVDDSY